MEHSIESTLIYGTLELYFQYKAEQLERVPNGTTRTGTEQNSWNSRKTGRTGTSTEQKSWNKHRAEERAGSLIVPLPAEARVTFFRATFGAHNTTHRQL